MKYSIIAKAFSLVSIQSFCQAQLLINNSSRNDSSLVISEQTQHGACESPTLTASFEGLGFGFEGPQGSSEPRNLSDNSLAVGPDHNDPGPGISGEPARLSMPGIQGQPEQVAYGGMSSGWKTVKTESEVCGVMSINGN